MYNILLACDTEYYHTWAINCIKSIQFYVPWIKITVAICNPKDINEIPKINYHYVNYNFTNEDSKIPYFQALRFLLCAELFPNDENVLSIDCDTILTRSFTQLDFENLCKTQHVLKHHKENRWLAGFITFGKDDFRHKFREYLLQIPITNWTYGRDQEVLKTLSSEYKFKPIEIGNWVSFGKGKGIFLTLKGSQKNSIKYMPNYNENLKKIQYG